MDVPAAEVASGQRELHLGVLGLSPFKDYLVISPFKEYLDFIPLKDYPVFSPN